MIFLTIFFLAILIIYPIWDYFFMKNMKQVGVNKGKLYRTSILSQWVLVFIIIIYWILTERSLHSLFWYDEPIYSSMKLNGFFAGLLTSLILVILVITFSKKVRNKLAEYFIDDSIAFLLPETKQDRFLFLIVSLTAGICEEIIFRGTLVYYLNTLPFDFSIIVIGIISSIIFGLVHLYQGWKGVVTTSILGFGLFFLFIRTGTLLVPMLIHFLIDAKFVFLPNVKGKPKQA